jgi:hypothetical protein
MGKLDELTVQGREMKCALGKPALTELADLVLRLHQDATTQQGVILPHAMMRSYRERSEDEREGMRSACKHVLVALVLLGIIDAPDL